MGGEVTRGRWKVHSDQNLTGLKSSQVKLVLSHILVSTESGPVIKLTAGKEGDYIGVQQRIPIRKRNLCLAVPSCFSQRPDKLVERDFSDKELMSAYDLEENVQNALLSYSKHARVPLSRDFAMEAPLKVLHTVAKLIRSAWERSLDPDEVTGMESGIIGDEVDVGPVALRCRKGDRGRELEGSKLPCKLPRKLESQSEEDHIKNQIASKNDDAPADTADWDICTVNNFTPPEVAYSKGESSSKVMFQEDVRSRILVCKPGTYHPDKHGRLFDSL